MNKTRLFTALLFLAGTNAYATENKNVVICHTFQEYGYLQNLNADIATQERKGYTKVSSTSMNLNGICVVLTRTKNP